MKTRLVMMALVCALALSCTPRIVKVACIGDSITYGSGLENQLEQAYPAELQRLLGDRYEVRNFGFSARCMSDSADIPYMNEEMYAEAKAFLPDVVTIKLGTNDTKPQNWNPKQYKASYEKMISEISALESKPEIFLCLPAKAFSKRWGINDSIIVAGVIPIINELASEHKLKVIDCHSATENSAANFPDEIHPDVEGSALLARTIYGTLSENGYRKR